MTERKWTAGPWRIGRGGPNLCPIVGTHGGLMVAMVSYGERHPTQANAHLISAAPDLYEAVIELQEALSEAREGQRVTTGNDALAKARGENQ